MAITLILGGARSGKSTYALELVAGREDVVFFATAQAWDEEMRERIVRHQAERPLSWRTIEAATGVGDAISKAGVSKNSVIVVDCVTMLASNVLMAVGEEDSEGYERALREEVEDLVEACAGCDLVLVSNEVGLGIVPAYRSGRMYRDGLGRVNQHLAKQADSVIFMVSGLPLTLK